MSTIFMYPDDSNNLFCTSNVWRDAEAGDSSVDFLGGFGVNNVNFVVIIL